MFFGVLIRVIARKLLKSERDGAVLCSWDMRVPADIVGVERRQREENNSY